MKPIIVQDGEKYFNNAIVTVDESHTGVILADPDDRMIAIAGGANANSTADGIQRWLRRILEDVTGEALPDQPPPWRYFAYRDRKTMSRVLIWRGRGTEPLQCYDSILGSPKIGIMRPVWNTAPGHESINDILNVGSMEEISRGEAERYLVTCILDG